MSKRSHIAGRGISKKHSTVTDSAAQVIGVLRKLPDVKRIAPGQIKQSQKKGGKKFLTLVHTNAGLEMIVTGNSVQKVTVFTENSKKVAAALLKSKDLQPFTITERERRPGI